MYTSVHTLNIFDASSAGRLKIAFSFSLGGHTQRAEQLRGQPRITVRLASERALLAILPPRLQRRLSRGPTLETTLVTVAQRAHASSACPSPQLNVFFNRYHA